MKRKLIRNIIYTLSILMLGCIGSVITCNYIIDKNAARYLYREISEIPGNEVGLLLGTSPKLRNGKNNLYFDHRINAAIQLYKAGKIKYILISGDNRQRNYNEPEYMKKALLRGGIPEEAIYLDYAGFRTLDSVVRAQKVFGQARFTGRQTGFSGLCTCPVTPALLPRSRYSSAISHTKKPRQGSACIYPSARS